MSDSTGDENKKDNAKAVSVTPGGKPRVKSLAGMGAFKGTGQFNKLMEQKKSQYMNQPSTNKPVIIKQVVPTHATEVENTAKTSEPIVEPVVAAAPKVMVEIKVDKITTQEVVEPAPVTESKPTQIPQSEVFNTSKLRTIAACEVIETPRSRGNKQTQIPREIPHTKVFEKPAYVPNQNQPPVAVMPNNYFKGNALILLKTIFDEVLKHGGMTTGKTTLQELSDLSSVNIKTTDRLLTQFVRDESVTVIESRRGNNGYRILALSQSVFNYMTKFTSIQIPHQIPQIHSSKEVSKFNNIITNYTPQNSEVFDAKKFNFKDLDFTEVAPLHPMQVNSSIRKQAEEKLEKEEMQLFVDKFMVWMSTQKNVQSVIGLFVSKIKEYIQEGDSPVMQCLSKKEHLAEKEFRARAEQLQREHQMVEKYRNEVASIALDERYTAWISSLSSDDKMNLVPESNLAKLGSAAHNGALKAYFIENMNIDQ